MKIEFLRKMMGYVNDEENKKALMDIAKAIEEQSEEEYECDCGSDCCDICREDVDYE